MKFFLFLFVSTLFSSCAVKPVAIHKKFPFICFELECRIIKGHGNLKSRRPKNKVKPSFKRRGRKKDDNGKVEVVKGVEKSKKTVKTSKPKGSNMSNDSLKINSKKILITDSLPKKRVVVVNDSIYTNFLVDHFNISTEEEIVIKMYLDSINVSAIKKVTVTGFTDSDGSEDYNRDLSFRRAEAVSNYLKSYGILASKITIRAEGESAPQKSNSTAEGKKQNRRVKIVIER